MQSPETTPKVGKIPCSVSHLSPCEMVNSNTLNIIDDMDSQAIQNTVYLYQVVESRVGSGTQDQVGRLAAGWLAVAVDGRGEGGSAPSRDCDIPPPEYESAKSFFSRQIQATLDQCARLGMDVKVKTYE